MSEWKKYFLRDIALDFAMGPFGSNIKAENFVPSGVPIIKGSNMNYGKFVDGDFSFLTADKAMKLKSSSCVPGDLVFTHRGTIGQVALIPEKAYPKYIVSQSGMKLSVNPERLDNNYLYYFFKSNIGQYELLKNESQVGVPSISSPLSSLKSVEITLPSLPEQKAIAGVLSSLDDKIDLLHRQNKTLEAMAETLFRQWFIEKAEDDWEEVPIINLYEIRDGTHDSPKQKSFGKKLITSRHLSDFTLDFMNAYYISEEDFHNINKRSQIHYGDILFSMIGTLGLIYLEQSKNIDYAIKNIGLFKTSQNPKWIFFTYLWLKSTKGRDFIHEHRNGSTQEYIALGSLRSIIFNVPKDNVLFKFNETVKPLFDKIHSNQKQLIQLIKIRDGLLPKLVAGEVQVDYE